MFNPFFFNGYYDAEHFCDRQEELRQLVKNVQNGVNTTLIAQRRMGKTGLILRLINEFRILQSPIQPIYLDIFATRNLADFNKSLAEVILNRFPEKTPIGQRLWQHIKGLRPLLGYDQFTGSVQVELTYRNESEKEVTLENLLQILNQQESPILLVLDEFQQIREYPEDNIEALLRSQIQFLHNVSFIFCGSKKHMMVDIFSNPKKPYYSSTAFLGLNPIPHQSYADYIIQLFERHGRKVEPKAVDLILDWSRRHTYYTQRICHHIFATQQDVTLDVVRKCCVDLLSMEEPYFLQIRQLLTPGQWNYLIALAKENQIQQPCATSFLKKYGIGTAPVSRRHLNSLIEKDIVITEIHKSTTSYYIGDLFLMRWLEREY